MYKKFIISLFLFSNSLLPATDEYREEVTEEPSLINPCSKMEKEGVLPQARKCIGYFCEDRCFGLIAKLDFLYFQPKEDGFAFVAKNSPSSQSPLALNLNATASPFDFAFKPGLKLGVGFYVPRLSWDFFFNWTMVKSKCKESQHKNLTANGEGLIPLFWDAQAFDNISNPIRFSHSHAHLDFSFDSLDILLGDSFYTSPHITLSIHGGLKGAKIKQKFYVSYADGNNITSLDGSNIHLLSGLTQLRSSSKGLGPELTLDSNWNICKSNFNLLASGGISILLTQFFVRYHEFDNALNITSNLPMNHDFKIHEYIWVLRPIGQLDLGLSWGRCFGCSKNYFFGINASYEMQYFWEQNLFRKLVDREVVGMSYQSKGDLLLHGVVLSTHFEY
jgi:hypothetical protein